MSTAREPVNGTLHLNWPETLTPSAPPAKRRQELVDDARIARRMATLAEMQATWPLTFDLDMPVPLAIGIHAQVRDALAISDEAAGDALRWWCHRAAYRAARMAGGHRYGLDGEPAGEVSDEHRDHMTKTVPPAD